MKSFLIGTIIVIATLVLTYKWWLPILFVSAEKGDFSANKIIIDAVTTTSLAHNEMAESITAIAQHKFINIDMTISLPLEQIDYYDFQLVKRNDYELGTEENVGDNFQDNYFNALPLTNDGDIANEWPINTDSFKMRLTFQVPTSATEGYLFYWGEYIGPLQFQ